MLDKADGTGLNDIAIVGMALRVPGARTVEEFWNNLVAGKESIRDVLVEELIEAGESAERIHQPNYVRRTAELPGMKMFDAEFFGMSPKEAAIMDPQHRQFLECTWEAMEDAGRMPETEQGPVGVFAGCGMGGYFYFNVCSNRALVDQVGMFLLRHTGNDKDFLSTRASFLFDLHGPSINVQTACSTSLVATHYACQSLLNGECDMALAGGVTIELPHGRGYLAQEGEILSPDGHCRPFDHRAQGTVFGSGVGVVVLRRLQDALADGDVIHAVIKSTAVNNDGHAKAGYLAPSVTGQAAAIIEAQSIAGIDADTIGYVECHGTGTSLGDPIEIEALTQAFRQTTDAVGFCMVGSVKSNIGHLDTAAGVVGLIKSALVVKNGMIPPTLGYEKPNPNIPFAATPFSVAQRLSAWPSIAGRRRAAVNSLGVGGTNAHAIVEQAPRRGRDHPAGNQPVIMMTSARRPAAADSGINLLSDRIKGDDTIRLEDAAYTLWAGRRRFEHNRLVAVNGRDDAIAALADPRRVVSQARLESVSGAAFLFPGGGAQYHRMAAELYEKDAGFRETIDEGLGCLTAEAERDIRAAWFEPKDKATAEALLRPSIQLPAILLVEVATARLWMRHGVQPVALLGHSMGENAAACIAGVLQLRDAVRLVRYRGELFDTVKPGGMLSVPLSAQELKEVLPASLDIASINGPSLSVVSGLNEDLHAFASLLAERDITTARIPVEIAAHSRSLDVILPQWEAFLRSIPLRAPQIPMISNVTGDWLKTEEATDPIYWVRHLRSTVHFADGLAKIASPHRLYIEVGPGKTLCSLAKTQGALTADQIINSLPHPEEAADARLHLLTALGRAKVAGLQLDTSVLWGGAGAARTSLPTYQFQHAPYFIEPAKPDVGAALPDLRRQAEMSLWGYRPSWKQSLAEFDIDAESGTPQTWLFFINEDDVASPVITRLRDLGHKVVTVGIADAFVQQTSEAYVLCPELGASGYTALMQNLAADSLLPSRIVHLWLVTESDKSRAGSNLFHRNQECGFYSLLHIARTLAEFAEGKSTHLTIITNGMYSVRHEALPYPEKATVLGPALVIPRELPNVSVKLIDLEVPPPPMKRRLLFSRQPLPRDSFPVKMLWSDLLSTPSCEIVAYRGGERWTRSYSRMPFERTDDGLEKLKQGGVYLFTGGLGGISRALSSSLATELNAKLVMIGRTKLPPRADWPAYRRQNGADPVRKGIESILELEAKGAEVHYECADVTDLESTTAAFNAAADRFGNIDGVFHTAGFVDDGLMQIKTEDSIEKVLAPKLLGTRVLDEVMRGRDIDLLVLFSSTSTVTAPAGQADYVAANSYLDAYADSCLADPDRKTISLHWGVWNDIGMAARAIGMVPTTPAIPEAVPAGGIYSRWVEDEAGLAGLEVDLGPESNWYLDHHRLTSGSAVLPGTAYVELIAQAAREHDLSGCLTIRDLVMLRPLIVPDGETRAVRTTFERCPEGLRVSILAAVDGGSRNFEKHIDALLMTTGQVEKSSIDLEAIKGRLPMETTAPFGKALESPQEGHINFGARWKVLRSTRLGKNEALGILELPDEFRSDVDEFLVHPALMDIATGFGLPLCESYRGSDVLWAPVSYGEISLFGTLPARIVSHVTLVPHNDFGPDFVCFDAVITDESGTVLLTAKRFLMKQMDTDQGMAEIAQSRSVPEPPQPTSHSAVAAKLAAQVRQGIAPSEGFECLLRALSSGVTQPIVSSLDLEALRARAAIPIEDGIGVSFERPATDAAIVLPRNPVETALAGFWQELLGVKQVGVHDNFFDYGGHSLIAVRLFRMIKKELGADLPMSSLYAAPTIAQCAELIGSDCAQPVAASPAGKVRRPMVHLTLMHPGQNPDAAPLFICAGMFGNILNLRHLALHVGADRPVYGLQARGIYGDMEPHESFEAMAEDYLAEIMQVQPSGVYHLAGYSGGGITALEIARQLQASGRQVPHLIMLDTPEPTERTLSLADKVSMKAQDLRRHRLSYLSKWLRERRSWNEKIRRKESAENEPASSEHFSNDRIEQAFRRALRRYNIRRYENPVTVFRPKPNIYYRLSGGRRLQANRNFILDDNGWSPHFSRLSIVEASGDHDSMVLEPHVRTLARRIRKIIENSECELGAAMPAID